jgi:hypothetical protein
VLSGGSSPYACGGRGAEAAAAHPAARSTTPATRRSRHHVDRLRYEPLNTDRSNNEQSEALSLAKAVYLVRRKPHGAKCLSQRWRNGLRFSVSP